MGYPEGLKLRMVERMIGPNAISPDRLARESGISNTALWKWRKEALDGPFPSAHADEFGMAKKKPQQWSAQEKLRVILEAAAASEEELGALLRREGVREAELELWKHEMLEELEGSAAHKRASRQRAGQDQKRIRELERELARKERALSEAAALLLLQKKVRQIWGDEDDDTALKNEP